LGPNVLEGLDDGGGVIGKRNCGVEIGEKFHAHGITSGGKHEVTKEGGSGG